MNLREGVWYESIFSTFIGSTPYFTPLGFRVVKGVVELKIYQTTRIYSLLNLFERALLNIVDDPYLYYLAAFKDETGGIPESEINIIEGLPALKKAYGYVFARRKSVSRTKDCLIVNFEIEKTLGNSINFEIIEPYSRCRVFLIEMIIYASKIKSIRENLINDSINSFKEQLDYSHKIVEKTCLNEKDLELASKLKEMVLQWLRK